MLFWFCGYCVYIVLHLCWFVSDYARSWLAYVLTCGAGLFCWVFPAEFFSKEGFLKCFGFSLGDVAIPLNHCFVLPPALRFSGAWLYVSFLLC